MIHVVVCRKHERQLIIMMQIFCINYHILFTTIVLSLLHDCFVKWILDEKDKGLKDACPLVVMENLCQTQFTIDT
jgi:hypothetical protein